MKHSEPPKHMVAESTWLLTGGLSGHFGPFTFRPQEIRVDFPTEDSLTVEYSPEDHLEPYKDEASHRGWDWNTHQFFKGRVYIVRENVPSGPRWALYRKDLTPRLRLAQDPIGLMDLASKVLRFAGCPPVRRS